MQCPNCSFEIQGNPRLCPNCSDTLPQPTEWGGVDFSIHYWIIFGNMGTIILGVFLLVSHLLGSLGIPLGIALLLLVALSFIISRGGRVWDDEPFWKKALIAVGPWLSIGAILVLIAYLFYSERDTLTDPLDFDPIASYGKKQRQQDQQDSHQGEQAQ